MNGLRKYASLTAAAVAAAMGLTMVVQAADTAKHPKHIDWSFGGPLGTFDLPSAQRGFQVFKQVCSSCHSLNYFRFRNLADIGYPEAQIKAIAAEYIVPGEPDDYGDPTERAALPRDAFPSPYPNENAARAANNNALPPDLSVIVKARHGGADYIYSLLTGYDEVLPADAAADIPDGLNYNPWFPGAAIAMAAPLMEGIVEYQEGQPEATVDQMARDVTQFLTFVAEPSLSQRHQMGVRVMIFLLVLTILFYLSMKRIWKPVKEGKNVNEA